MTALEREEFNKRKQPIPSTLSPEIGEGGGAPKEVHPVFKGWDSERLIGHVRLRFQELIHKGWEWRSFYNGWLEGRAEMLQQNRIDFDALQQEITQLKKERDAYRSALQEIEDPTKFIQARADAEGKPMDGQRAFALSFDPVHLRGIATLALKQFLK